MIFRQLKKLSVMDKVLQRFARHICFQIFRKQRENLCRRLDVTVVFIWWNWTELVFNLSIYAGVFAEPKELLTRCIEHPQEGLEELRENIRKLENTDW